MVLVCIPNIWNPKMLFRNNKYNKQPIIREKQLYLKRLKINPEQDKYKLL